MGCTERPVFACRQAMQEHMRRLEVRSWTLWARWLARPGKECREAFLNDYLPRPLGGQAPLRPFKRVRPQCPRCQPTQPPPAARPAGTPRALGRGLGTARVLCPAHGAATCAACAATGHGIKCCCSFSHEAHRLAPAAQGQGRCVRGFKRPSRWTSLRPPHTRCWAAAGGSRRKAHQRMSRRRRGSTRCRRQCWGGDIGRHESALPPATTSHRAGGPLLGLGHRFPTLSGTPAPTTHGDMWGEGRAAGWWVSHSSSHGRTTSVALASCLQQGGGRGHPRWLRRRPRFHCPPPPLQPWARPAAGARGKDVRASLADVFGSISAALVAAARADGTQGDPPPPRDREQQGAAGWLRAWQGPGASLPFSDQGQQDAAGQDVGQQSAAGHWVVQEQGQPEAAALGQGCQGQGQGQGQGGSPPPPGAVHPPPPPPSVGGQDRHRRAAMRHGGAGQRVGQTDSGAPCSTGVRQPVCRPAGRGGGGGGALEPGLHSASAVIGRWGGPTLHSRTFTCGRGWGIAQPEIWAGSLLGGSHIGWRPRSFRRAAIRGGGGQGG